MNIKNLQVTGSLFALFCLSSTTFAEKAPLSAEALQDEAQAIVVATIEQIRIESEASTFEQGFGNSDWGIYLTLSVESVEKGQVHNTTLEARCFRIKTRRSLQEYLTPSGHHPIPGIGTRVRAYLERRDGSWDVVLPNGIAVHGDESAKILPDAKEVTQLRSLAYTFVLPLEGWLLVAFVGLLVLTFIGWQRRRRRTLVAKEPQNATGISPAGNGAEN